MQEILSKFAERLLVGTYVVVTQSVALYLLFVWGAPVILTEIYLPDGILNRLFVQLQEPWTTLATAAFAAAGAFSVVLIGLFVEVTGLVGAGADYQVLAKQIRMNMHWFSEVADREFPHYREEFARLSNTRHFFPSLSSRYLSCKYLLLAYVLSTGNANLVKSIQDTMQVSRILQSLWLPNFVFLLELIFTFESLVIMAASIIVIVYAACLFLWYSIVWHIVFSTLDIGRQRLPQHVQVKSELLQPVARIDAPRHHGS